LFELKKEKGKEKRREEEGGFLFNPSLDCMEGRCRAWFWGRTFLELLTLSLWDAPSTADDYKQKAVQHLNRISRGFLSYGNGEHSNILTCLIDDDSEHVPYSYESCLT
jgi:hypothetical protein